MPSSPALSTRGARLLTLALLVFTMFASAARAASAQESVPYAEGFEAENGMAGWTNSGDVKIDDTEAFKGKRALVLSLPQENVRQNTSATGPSFPISAGTWDVQLAAKSELTSQDNSYKGAVLLQYLDAGGNATGQAILAEQTNKTNWQSLSKQVEVPERAVAARIVARIEKETPGKFWVDEISAKPAAVKAQTEAIKYLLFSTAREGNLIFPGDPKTLKLSVRAATELPGDCVVNCTVRDYWGAEQAAAITVKAAPKGQKNNLFVYEGEADLAGVPLEIGRYYEVHGEIAGTSGVPFRNYTSFAILPEAPANSFKAEEVPFTSRNWDNRFPEYIRLTKRLGIRIVGGYTTWEADPPYSTKLSEAALIRKEGLGLLQTTMAMAIERRGKNWLKWTEPALRESIRNFLEAHKDIRPLVINLGNEPHSKGDEVKVDVDAYRILYTEIKKVDPSIFVVGTSVGAGNEDYFKAGFGEWCDAYDFHVYEPAEKVREILTVQYPAMFKKYGFPKPIWSTELGLNSQGMQREQVAAELIKKFSSFFAGGGASVSWFGLLYPDADGTRGESSSSAHNVFDCRYNLYAPKLDAIAYYNAVNGICIKKFVTDKVYGENLNAFLFQDRDGQSLQVLYKTKGREDVFVPLPGVDAVQLIRIDGRRIDLDAGGQGVTLTVGEDPLLLLYKGGPNSLPSSLEKPAIALASPADSLVSGQQASLAVSLNGAPADGVELKAPPFWEVSKEADGQAVRFSVRPPENSSAREGDLHVSLNNAAGKPCADLVWRPRITGSLSMEVLAVARLKDQPEGIKLIIRNNGPKPQEVAWSLELKNEQPMKGGAFKEVRPAGAYFSETPEGRQTIAPDSVAEITVPLEKVAPNTLYQVSARVRDASGRTLTAERPAGGFVAVMRAKRPPTLDGTLDEADWAAAPAATLDKAEQFFVIRKNVKPPPTWTDAKDLSGTLKFLWDDQYLYVAAEITDDLTGQPQQAKLLWAQDGIQMLIDGDRPSAQKRGKNDYAMGIGVNGPQAWCYQAASPAILPGEAKDIRISARRKDEKTGNVVYEFAIPWSRLDPFQPKPGANLGMTIALNEDDGPGRESYLAWFGNVQTKDISAAGDLILQGDKD